MVSLTISFQTFTKLMKDVCMFITIFIKVWEVMLHLDSLPKSIKIHLTSNLLISREKIPLFSSRTIINTCYAEIVQP